MPVKVDVEYCYGELANKILAKVPAAEVNGREGRKTSFEIMVNGTLIHSKLQTMAFPDFEEVVNIVEEVDGGANARSVVKMKANCAIM